MFAHDQNRCRPTHALLSGCSMWVHTCMLFSCQHIHVILDKMSVLAPHSDRDAATSRSRGTRDGEQDAYHPQSVPLSSASLHARSSTSQAYRRMLWRERYGVRRASLRLSLSWSGALESRSVTRHPRELGKTRVHVKGQKDMPALCLILRAAAGALLCSVGVDAFRLPTLHITSQRWAVCCPRICARSSHSEQSHSPLR